MWVSASWSAGSLRRWNDIVEFVDEKPADTTAKCCTERNEYLENGRYASRVEAQRRMGRNVVLPESESSDRACFPAPLELLPGRPRRQRETREPPGATQKPADAGAESGTKHW